MKDTKQRTIKCIKCGKQETERVFGSGFPGWIRICELTYLDETTGKEYNPEICPDCKILVMNLLENK